MAAASYPGLGPDPSQALDRIGCRRACPAHTDAGRYARAIARGDWRDAVREARARNPLVSVCAAICPHPCEDHCARGGLDAALALRALKRAALAQVNPREVAPAPSSDRGRGHRVAVVGAGPAGLSVAHDLVLLGYGVTLLERDARAGGMPAQAILPFRLPPDALQRDIDGVLALGVELRCGVAIDAECGVDELLADGFGRVVVATGSPLGRALPVDGAGLPGVVDGLTLLRRLARGEPVELGRRVAVIGGGDTAVDVAAAVRRLGPDGRLVPAGGGEVPVDRVPVNRMVGGLMPVDREVTLVFRRRQLADRAHAEQARGAALDGVGTLGRVLPLEIAGRGRVEGLRLARVATYHDAGGRYRPRPLPGSEWRMEVDTVIAAAGRVPDGPWGGDPLRIEDAGTVIHAVAAGQRAAARIDRELTGGGEAPRPVPVRPAACAVTHPRPTPGRRASAPEVRGPERLLLRPVEGELSPLEAAREGARCLDCRITVESQADSAAERCALCGRCVEGCPTSALWLEPVEMGTALRYDPGRCLRCGLCVERCPAGCLRTTALFPEAAGGHG